MELAVHHGVRKRWEGEVMLQRLWVGALVVGAALAYTTSAWALSFTVEVLDAGVSQGSMNQMMMNCAGTAPSFNCMGTGAAIGNLDIDMWNFSLDEDPVVSGTTAVTNNSGVTAHYTMIVTLAITAPTTPSSLIGGSMQGGATDNNGDGVTLATFTATSLYAAQIDGATVQTLYNDPQSFSAGGFLSVNVPQTSFGTPIPSQPAVAAFASIAIVYDFTLTANDSATFTSNFVVVPVPEPSTALLVGMGLLGMAISRRRDPSQSRG